MLPRSSSVHTQLFAEASLQMLAGEEALPEGITMPRRLAITAPHVVEVIEYEDRPPQPAEVLVRTQIASGKHGTFTDLAPELVVLSDQALSAIPSQPLCNLNGLDRNHKRDNRPYLWRTFNLQC